MRFQIAHCSACESRDPAVGAVRVDQPSNDGISSSSVSHDDMTTQCQQGDTSQKAGVHLETSWEQVEAPIHEVRVETSQHSLASVVHEEMEDEKVAPSDVSHQPKTQLHKGVEQSMAEEHRLAEEDRVAEERRLENERRLAEERRLLEERKQGEKDEAEKKEKERENAEKKARLRERHQKCRRCLIVSVKCALRVFGVLTCCFFTVSRVRQLMTPDTDTFWAFCTWASSVLLGIVAGFGGCFLEMQNVLHANDFLRFALNSVATSLFYAWLGSDIISDAHKDSVYDQESDWATIASVIGFVAWVIALLNLMMSCTAGNNKNDNEDVKTREPDLEQQNFPHHVA